MDEICICCFVLWLAINYLRRIIPRYSLTAIMSSFLYLDRVKQTRPQNCVLLASSIVLSYDMIQHKQDGEGSRMQSLNYILETKRKKPARVGTEKIKDVVLKMPMQ